MIPLPPFRASDPEPTVCEGGRNPTDTGGHAGTRYQCGDRLLQFYESEFSHFNARDIRLCDSMHPTTHKLVNFLTGSP